MRRGANSQIDSLLPGSFVSPKTFSCLICLDHEVLGAGIVAQHTRLIMQMKTSFSAKIDGEMARLRVRSVRKSATFRCGFGAVIFVCCKASWYFGYCGCYGRATGIRGNGAAGCAGTAWPSAGRRAQPRWGWLVPEHPPPHPLLRVLQQPQPLRFSFVSRWPRE